MNDACPHCGSASVDGCERQTCEWEAAAPHPANLRTPNAPSDPRLLAACLRLGVDTASTPDDLRTFWAEHAGARTLLTPTQHEWLRAAANARRQALRGEAP